MKPNSTSRIQDQNDKRVILLPFCHLSLLYLVLFSANLPHVYDRGISLPYNRHIERLLPPICE
jgi:hypothetical protein